MTTLLVSSVACFLTARPRTIDLVGLLHEGLAAVRAGFRSVALVFRVGIYATARTAAQTFTGCLFAAINAVFRVHGRLTEFLSMHLAVTVNAKRDSVGYIEGEFWTFRKWLDVVRLYIAAVFAALLASVVVSFVNAFAPFTQCALVFASGSVRSNATLPCGGFLTDKRFSAATAGTESSISISTQEGFSAILALLRLGWVTDRPTFFGAIPCVFSTIGLRVKLFTTLFAHLEYLSVFHSVIIPQKRKLHNSTVQDAFGITGVRLG